VHRAITVGPQDAHIGVCKPLEQFGVGMAVGIAFSDGNNCDARFDGGQELRSSRILAAVMANLQYVRLQLTLSVLRKHPTLGFLFGIARQ